MSTPRDFDHWVPWRWEVKEDGKRTKVPFDLSGRRMSWNKPQLWASYDEAKRRSERQQGDGVGYVLWEDDPFAIFDLDHCRSEDGTIAGWATEVVRRFDSYAERSPGDGVRVWIEGKKPGGRCQHKEPELDVEIYDHKRFVTVTFDRLEDAPQTIRERQVELDAFYHELFPDKPPSNGSKPSAGKSLTAYEVLQLARQHGNAAKWERLMRGDASDYPRPDGTPDLSAADSGLCCLAAFYTRDPGTIDQIIRMSGLSRPKWTERGDYPERTIAGALETVTEMYDPGGELRSSGQGQRNGAGPAKEEPAESTGVDLPEIVSNGRPLQDMTADALDALTAANHPASIFQRGRELVRVVRNAEQRPLIQPMDHHALRGEAARSAIYVRAMPGKNGTTNYVKTPPPMDVVHDIRALRSWSTGIPPLTDIIEAPSLRPDGSIITAAGYDEATHVFYAPDPDLKLPPIPMQPTEDQLMDAVALIEDAIGEFPFVSSEARANAFGLLLTPLVRTVLGNAPAPLALLDAPQQGSGKSLLARVISVLATGQEAAAFTAPTEESEWRKSITALVRAGSAFVLIDNVDLVDRDGQQVALHSSALSAVLTTCIHRDRVLGVSDLVELPTHATWCASGNNLQVGGDLIRRCYRIRLDAKVSRPWMRSGFRHPELIEYIRQQRGRLLVALLTLCRAWFVAGCPRPSSPIIGSFEAWSRTVGGILETAGVDGFLRDLGEVYEMADAETPEWEAFLTCWRDELGDRWLAVADLDAEIRSDGRALRTALPSDLADRLDGKSFRKCLGQALRKRLGVRHGDEQLYLAKKSDSHSKVQQWRVAAESAGLAGLCGVVDTPSHARARAGVHAYAGKAGIQNPAEPRQPRTPIPVQVRVQNGRWEVVEEGTEAVLMDDLPDRASAVAWATAGGKYEVAA